MNIPLVGAPWFRTPLVSGGGGNDSNTKVLLHFDGANGSTTFTDSALGTSRIWTPSSAIISTAQSKFGGASGYFNGSSILTAPAHADFDMGSGDFTVDLWFRRQSSGVAASVYAQGNAVGSYQSQSMLLVADGRLLFSVFPPPAGTASVDLYSTTAFNATGIWNHAAGVRSGNTLRLFVNGAQEATAAYSAAVYGSPYTFTIGRLGDYNAYYFEGYMDEFRISKTARWTANFSPPSSPYG